MLAIETSSLRGSVALGRAGQPVGRRLLAAGRRSAADLLPALDDLLRAAGCRPEDVGTLCFSQGPGSFTGLRIAATVARLWQSVVGSRVVAVPSLEVIARGALALSGAPARLAVLLDARRGQVFGAVFERSGPDELTTVAGAGLHPAGEWLADLGAGCGVLGDGLAVHRAAAEAAGLVILDESTWLPDAAQVLALGWRLAAAGRFCGPAEIVPAYLRPPECEEVYEQRRTEARARRGE